MTYVHRSTFSKISTNFRDNSGTRLLVNTVYYIYPYMFMHVFACIDEKLQWLHLANKKNKNCHKTWCQKTHIVTRREYREDCEEVINCLPILRYARIWWPCLRSVWWKNECVYIGSFLAISYSRQQNFSINCDNTCVFPLV